MKKYRDDLELIRLSKSGDMKAQYELWKKWEPFTAKRFYQDAELFTRTGVAFEDFMQNAYLAFVMAVEKFDLEKAETTGTTNFSTFYYWYLKKLKNASEGYEYRYGDVALESEVHYQGGKQPHKEDAVVDPWNKAIARDITTDFKQIQAVEVIETFFEEEESSVLKNILTLMLQGLRTKAISDLLGDEFDIKAVAKMVWQVKKKLRVIGERVMLEPISC